MVVASVKKGTPELRKKGEFWARGGGGVGLAWHRRR
jgi:hypothetical protein